MATATAQNGEDGRLWTPNGRHRLAAGKVLGLKQTTVLISPDETLAYRIVPLNTEKAHTLRDRSLEVIRMASSLAERHPKSKESRYRAEFIAGAGGFAMRFPKTKKGDLAKHFRVESVSSAELAWVAVGADA